MTSLHHRIQIFDMKYRSPQKCISRIYWHPCDSSKAARLLDSRQMEMRCCHLWHYGIFPCYSPTSPQSDWDLRRRPWNILDIQSDSMDDISCAAVSPKKYGIQAEHWSAASSSIELAGAYRCSRLIASLFCSVSFCCLPRMSLLSKLTAIDHCKGANAFREKSHPASGRI